MRNKTEEKDKNKPAPRSGQPKDKKEKKKVSALQAANMARSAVTQANAHHERGLANTGTNISYEGATAPGAGGSAGTGYTSGKEGADEKISTDSSYDAARIGQKKNEKNKVKKGRNK